jgi:lipopolysaccharide export system ATP-binding protein
VSVLRAEGLRKSYRRRAVVEDVAVELAQGEIVGLLGPNGAGKTTTFYLITGLIRPDAGRIWLDDLDITNQPMYKRARGGIGYLAQEPSIFRRMTVAENVLAILETVPLSKAERHARLDAMLEDLGLTALRNAPAYTLSGGERRRLEITRALATNPKFMLLDEPFAGVDPIAVSEVKMLVKHLTRRGIGVLITDHSVRETLSLVDRAYLIHEGHVMIQGKPEVIAADPEARRVYLGDTFEV